MALLNNQNNNTDTYRHFEIHNQKKKREREQ